MKCYQKADCPHLQSEARAYSLTQKRAEINDIYLKAAHGFLKCDQSQHNYQCIENASKCSHLYVLLGQVSIYTVIVNLLKHLNAE